MEMKVIFKKTHKMTKEIVEKYNDVDYKTQFNLCLEYVLETFKDEKIEKLIEEVDYLVNDISRCSKNVIEGELHGYTVYFTINKNKIKFTALVEDYLNDLCGYYEYEQEFPVDYLQEYLNRIDHDLYYW